MLIATWNVNSVRMRLPRVIDWLATRRPDVLCMQETKVVDGDFPREPFEALGYRLEVFGQKTYNGVATASRHPMTDVVRGLPGEGPEDAKRVLEVTTGGIRVVNVYVPNGQEVGSEVFAAKLDWLRRLRGRLDAAFSPSEPLVLLGDMNVAPEDRDVYDPVRLAGTIHCSEPEREALRDVMAFGLRDAVRLFNDGPGLYSWWDYRAAMFRRNLGLRIDLLLVTEPLVARCRLSEVDKAARAGEKPSDHAPVFAEFA
ncbi:MAG: exodeoxyribonuclease III [Planctomycetes bacterium]|jgi:exodeoxyribonuclease-3|nr:exodeoxyribonuclease III [Planctomycetota bacterium]